jgi:Holliday junction resolvase
MRAKKVDLNQAEIVQAFRKHGCTVFDTHDIGKGFPDIECGYRGRNHLVEIKSSKKATMTKQELRFAMDWKGEPVCRVETTVDVQGFIDKWRKEK